MRLSLGDVLAHAPFDLELLTGDASARRRAVFGAHSIEIEHPSHWLPEHWLMLTHGVRLRGRSDEQRRMVCELADSHCVALGFGIGTVFKRVPPALLAEARSRAFPIFRIPYETSCRDITAYVYSSLLSSELHNTRRVLSCQEYLMDVLGEPYAERALVDRLASVLNRGVALFSYDGALLASSGLAMTRLPLPLPGPTGRIAEFEHDGRTIIAASVLADGRPLMHLAVVSGRTGDASQLVRSLVRTTTRLLILTASSRTERAERRRAARAKILLQLLGALPSERTESELEELAAAHGIDRASPTHIALITAADKNARASTCEVEAITEDHRLPALCAELDGDVVALVQGENKTLREWATSLVTQRMHVGLGRPLRTLADAPPSLRDARLAIRHGASTGAGLASVDELNLAVTTMAMTDSALVNRRAAALLAPLQPHPTLLETLRVYLEAELDITATGRSLTLHPNSVRYRLSRIEALLGVRLNTASAIADLYLALLASNSERNGSDEMSKPAVPVR